MDGTRKVDVDLFAFRYAFVKFGAFNYRQAGINRVAIKRPGKGTRDHGLDAQSRDGCDGLLPSAPTAEVSSCDEDFKIAELAGKCFAENFKGVLGEFLRFDVDEVAAREDGIGVDFASEPGD